MMDECMSEFARSEECMPPQRAVGMPALSPAHAGHRRGPRAHPLISHSEGIRLITTAVKKFDPSHPIFSSIRDDYPDFDKWFYNKCVFENREALALLVEGKLAGLAIFKSEAGREAGTRLAASKVLKLCTFKVQERFRGGRLGNLLLSRTLAYARISHHEAIYLTSFIHHKSIIRLLASHGFSVTELLSNEELRVERYISSIES
jgi:GNAT superfamily N-acetyltransferase